MTITRTRTDAMRRRRRHPLPAAVAAGLLLISVAALAHDGHDHSVVPPPPAESEPRINVVTPQLDLTGIVRGGRLWLYVSRLPDNAPWSGLQLEVEVGGESRIAEAAGEGTYRLPLPAGSTGALIATISGDGVSELVAATLPAATAD